jgi:signal transduction histidine kinase
MSSARTRLFQTEAFRLSAIYIGLFLASMLFLITLVYVIVSSAFEANLLRDSRDDLAAIHKAYVETKKKAKSLHEAKEMIDDRLLASDPDDLFLLEKNGVKIAGNLPLMKAGGGKLRFNYAPPAPERGQSGVLLGQGEYIAPGVYAFVGRDLYSAQQAEENVVIAFAFVFLVTLGIAGASGVLVSRSFVSRIDAITATCRSIMAGRFDDRVPVKSARNELDQLAATINLMLDRIGALMESLRQVSNDIAHDLRTPLAHLRLRLERARHGVQRSEDYAQAVDAAIADCDHLLAMFAALLRIAQMEAGPRLAGMGQLDLGELLENLRALYEPVLDDTQHPFSFRLGEGLRLDGDPQLLLRLFANLLDNAIKHTPEGTAIRVTAERRGEHIAVSVVDEGSGIPAEDRARVFRRFYRREQSRTTPGSGLGLSLASAIAELHGATIVLDDNKPGLRAEVEFPALGSARVDPAKATLAIRKDTFRNDHKTYSET